MILEKIKKPNDIHKIPLEDFEPLAAEIRDFLIRSVSQTGGHLASNLGVVELTLALHNVLDFPEDKLIWDVGHQAYTHKILTGRKDEFKNLRQEGGLSGFPKRSESPCDAYDAGHSSNSISAGLGYVHARDILGQKHHVVSVIGDGALTGGMAYEALNNAAELKTNFIIIINDNNMSISRNVGGMSTYLSALRTAEAYTGMKMGVTKALKKVPKVGTALVDTMRKTKSSVKQLFIPGMLFENMGLTYLGPVDGHDLPGLISLLTTAKSLAEPVVVHVVTKKGCGYRFAEEDPAKFHGIGAFDPETGKILAKKITSYSDSFGEAVMELAQKDDRICAITAAMPGGTGLLKFMREYPKRFFDVGIAEEHAISMAGGLAKQGMVPVAAIYSTFLQRAYDQIMQDIAMLHLHVILAVDRAGLVGDDGATHHGVFDVGFLRQVPGMLILTPASLAEQKDMLSWAAETYNGPVAVRYPRGGEGSYRDSAWQPGENVETEGLLCCHRHGGDVTLVTYGSMLDNVLEAAEILSRRGIEATVLRLLTVSALPAREILTEMSEKRRVIVAEEVYTGSGIREALAWELRKLCPDCRVDGVDLGADFVTHGSTKELYRHYGLDGESIANYTQGVLS